MATQRKFSPGRVAMDRQRYLILLGVTAVAFALLGVRLWTLQVIEGESYHQTSTQNLLRHHEIQAPRGAILDREGVALAENRPVYDVYIRPNVFSAHADDGAEALLQDYLGLSQRRMDGLRDRMASGQAEVRVARHVTRSVVAKLKEDQLRLPGVEVRPRLQRYYPLHHVGSHTVGYVSQIGPDRLRQLRPYGYRPGDQVGRLGLESAFDGVLHGSPGVERRVVDARGNPVHESEAELLMGEYRNIAPISGRDLKTTLDADLMAIIDEAMSDYAAGAAVVVDPRDGSVLASYSKPHFNANAWSGRLSAMEQRRSDTDPFNPMMDKAVSGFFPGSVFKIVGALAALEEGLVEPHDEIHCPGHHTFGGTTFRCWNRAGHGDMDAYSAIAQSCNVYYWVLAEELGMDRIAEYAHRFGFGERTGVMLNHEQSGRVPTRQWHDEQSPEGYQRGFDLNTIIGHGDNLMTPMQVAMAYAAIANGGKVYYPRLVDRIQNQQGEPLFEYAPQVRREVGASEEDMEVLRQSLRKTLHGARGTARRSAIDGIEAAGKTGTAQVARIGSVRVPDEERELTLRHHAWFAGFAPYDEPEVAVAVFLEHGGGGSSDAAPVATEIMERYLKRETPQVLETRIDGSYRPQEAP